MRIESKREVNHAYPVVTSARTSNRSAIHLYIARFHTPQKAVFTAHTSRIRCAYISVGICEECMNAHYAPIAIVFCGHYSALIVLEYATYHAPNTDFYYLNALYILARSGCSRMGQRFTPVYYDCVLFTHHELNVACDIAHNTIIAPAILNRGTTRHLSHNSIAHYTYYARHLRITTLFCVAPQ